MEFREFKESSGKFKGAQASLKLTRFKRKILVLRFFLTLGASNIGFALWHPSENVVIDSAW